MCFVMLQLTPQHRIFLYPLPVDFRKGIDKLVGFCRQQLRQDPFSGIFFCFRNKPMTCIKILVYDGTGFWLCQKRFSQGKIQSWPQNKSEADLICSVELQVILSQGKPPQLESSWHKLASSKL